MTIHTLAALALSSAVLLAQNGDRKGHTMIDRVPKELIPPAPYLNQADALKSFKIAQGFVLEPLTAEESLTSPVALAFDADGRAWVVEMTQYMVDLDGNHENKPTGRIKVLEDTTGDGFLDKVTIFMDKLVLPRALSVTSDGLLYTSGDTLYFTKRDGLKPTGKATIIDKDYAKGGNAEHKANGLLYGRDNWYYNAKSAKRYRRVNGKWISQKTDFRGQWGIAQDDAGRLYHNNNSTILVGDQFRPNFFTQHPNYSPKVRASHRVGSNSVYPIRVNPGLNRAYMKGTLGADHKLVNATAAAGMTIYRGDNFPAEYNGRGFTSEPGGNLVKMIDIKRDGSNKPIGAHPLGKEEFLASTDEWFRPVNVYTGPDGTLWMIDMYFGLLQHKAYMTSYLRKQYSSRDLDKLQPNNGRLYRIRFAANKASKPLKLSGKSMEHLIPALAHPNGTTRDTAQRLIVERLTDASNKNINDDITHWNKYIRKAVGANPSTQLKLRGLWISEALQNVSNVFLKECLASKNSDVVSSALELAHYADNSENAHILTMTPTSQVLHSYLFALGKIGSKQSHNKAISLIEKNGKTALVREAYISGLGLNAKQVVNTAPIKDKNLQKLIKAAVAASGETTKTTGPKLTAAEQKVHNHGKALYIGAAACAGCHAPSGDGIPNLAPPLVPSDWITGNKERLLKVVLHGLKGPISVNKEKYNLPAVMPGIGQRPDLKDADIASILTYLRNENAKKHGKKGVAITAADVKKVRAATTARNSNPYTDKELQGVK